MSDLNIQERSKALSKLIEKKLGVRGRTLEAKLNRAPRSMPRWVRQEAMRLVEAERMAGHPKLLMQMDPQSLSEAHDRCANWLNGVDKGAKRRTFLLRLLAVNVLNIGFVLVALGVTLRLAGLL